MTTCPVCLNEKENTQLSLFMGDLWCFTCQEVWSREIAGSSPVTSCEDEKSSGCPICYDEDATDLVLVHSGCKTLDYKICKDCRSRLLETPNTKCTGCAFELETLQTPEQVQNAAIATERVHNMFAMQMQVPNLREEGWSWGQIRRSFVQTFDATPEELALLLDDDDAEDDAYIAVPAMMLPTQRIRDRIRFFQRPTGQMVFDIILVLWMLHTGRLALQHDVLSFLRYMVSRTLTLANIGGPFWVDAVNFRPGRNIRAQCARIRHQLSIHQSFIQYPDYDAVVRYTSAASLASADELIEYWLDRMSQVSEEATFIPVQQSNFLQEEMDRLFGTGPAVGVWGVDE